MPLTNSSDQRKWGDCMDQDELLVRSRELLAEVHVLSLATTDAEGRPHAANVYFAADERFDLYFISDPASAHGMHVAAWPTVAAAVYPEVDDHTQIRGLQLHGRVTLIPDDQWEAAWTVYLAKFPFVVQLADLAEAQQIYRLTPTWLRYIDNRIAFGFKWETDWPVEPQSGGES